MKNPLEESKELVEQGLGTIQQIYVGGSEFETWFIYSGKSVIHLGDLTLENGDM